MDAASRTGVDDIRELTDGVRYSPVSARYKIYIIDEVHMLSKPAFNALLKTLEEPPPDVKFIFATTEIHKVPVTVLSRCQRFSLRRVPAEILAAHYTKRRAGGESRRGRARGDRADRARRRRLGARRAVDARPGDRALRRPRSPRRGARDARHRRPRPRLRPARDRACKGDAAGALTQMAALYEGGADPVIGAPGTARAGAFPDPAEARARGRRGRSRARGRPRRAACRWRRKLGDRRCWRAPGRCC